MATEIQVTAYIMDEDEPYNAPAPVPRPIEDLNCYPVGHTERYPVPWPYSPIEVETIVEAEGLNRAEVDVTARICTREDSPAPIEVAEMTHWLKKKTCPLDTYFQFTTSQSSVWVQTSFDLFTEVPHSSNLHMEFTFYKDKQPDFIANYQDYDFILNGSVADNIGGGPILIIEGVVVSTTQPQGQSHFWYNNSQPNQPDPDFQLTHFIYTGLDDIYEGHPASTFLQMDLPLMVAGSALTGTEVFEMRHLGVVIGGFTMTWKIAEAPTPQVSVVLCTEVLITNVTGDFFGQVAPGPTVFLCE